MSPYFHQELSENREGDPGGGCSKKPKVQVKLNKVTKMILSLSSAAFL